MHIVHCGEMHYFPLWLSCHVYPSHCCAVMFLSQLLIAYCFLLWYCLFGNVFNIMQMQAHSGGGYDRNCPPIVNRNQDTLHQDSE